MLLKYCICASVLINQLSNQKTLVTVGYDNGHIILRQTNDMYVA